MASGVCPRSNAATPLPVSYTHLDVYKRQVYTQPGAIYQIVVNLVTNSMTHAFTGIAHGRMQIQAAADGDGWVLHYSDNGVGMEAVSYTHLDGYKRQ